MPKSKFEHIYRDLKEKIESEKYPYMELLPSENQLIEVYDCSRNTVRRAIKMLATEGYVQSQHGVGVRSLYRPIHRTNYLIGGIETFKDSAIRNNITTSTHVISFEDIICDQKLAETSGFEVGTPLYYIKKVRCIDDKPVILDINYFSKRIITDLTKDIVEQSCYDYFENDLHIDIATSKRLFTVERVTKQDQENLELNDYNCMAVIRGHVFTAGSELFEYTISRHRPDYFAFADTAIRKHV